MSSVEVVTELPRLAVGVYLKDQTENLLAEDGCVTVYEGEQVQLVIELANRESRLDVECLKFIIAEEAQADAERMALRSKWTGCFSSEFERSTLLWSDGVTLLANDDDDTDLELPGIKVGERASFVLTLPGSKLISNLGIHLTYTAKGHSHWRYESLLLRFECHRSLYVSLHPFCYDVSEFCEKLLVYLEVEHLRPQDSFVFEIVKAKGTGSSTTIVRSPLGNSPLGNSPLGNSPLGNSPLGNSPLGNSPLGERGDVVVRYEIPTEGQLTKVPLCVPRSWINSRDPIQSLWQRIIKTYRFQWTCGSKKGTAIVTPIQSGGDMGTSAAFLSSAGTLPEGTY
ncbi:hypothetical protein GNI_097500 [Gregarina niphandrodes]|uniref:Uncharacterized protein n=1 Tax=Gregarina niphandrodes TaxID=110365 RepID=A0A023B4Z1_GRENI|nr:hypothetical protein GNI_097500 [Gregarina niphandrodes]EZG57605.1 hypothetical protein GNI_097500 [Gregarina niphandrodes]|eukprot:XP_011131048.1 hypothetical protein GNI_097500 [Gregarina niphandrodes]